MMSILIGAQRDEPRTVSFLTFLLHQSAAYTFLQFGVPLIALVVANLPYVRSSFEDSSHLLFAHLFLFAFVPALLVGLFVNRTLRHRSAAFVWLIPVAIFAFQFIFESPTVYPTMVLQSDFVSAFRMWMGDGYNSRWPAYANRLTAYYQFKFTASAYVALAYSIGAWLALRFTSVGQKVANASPAD